MLLGDCLIRMNMLEEATVELKDTLNNIAVNGDRLWESELIRLQGQVHLAQAPSGTAQALVYFNQALHCARTQGAAVFELRAAASLAECLSLQGNHAQAREALQPVINQRWEGIDTPDIQHARSILDGLG